MIEVIKLCILLEQFELYCKNIFMIAYIDPGLGGLVVQSLIAGCLTVVWFFRNSFAKLFGFVKRLFGGKPKE
jgi:hypothetical protein